MRPEMRNWMLSWEEQAAAAALATIAEAETVLRRERLWDPESQ